MLNFPAKVADGLAYVGDMVWGTSIPEAGGIIIEIEQDRLKFRDGACSWEACHYQLESRKDGV